MTPVIGMDVRIDERGRLQPWRVVVTSAEKPTEPVEYVMRLPSGMRYLTPPNHHVHGDLTELPETAADQMRRVATSVTAMGTNTAYAASAHIDGMASHLLAWHGVNLEPVDVDMPHDATLDDPYGIGEESGHEIAHIIKHLENDR